jgi:hypothetical protein
MAAGRWGFETGVLAVSLAAALGGKMSPNPFEPTPKVPEKTESEKARESRRADAIFDAFVSR